MYENCDNTETRNRTKYLYDAEGTRIAKGTITSWSCNTATNGFQITTSYILTPGNQQLTELAWSGNTPQWAHTNVWGAGMLLATYSADPDPTQNVAGILNFYIDDPLGTRRVMTDYAGNIAETCHSLPFGNGEDCAATPAEHLFTQHERDAETGNDYFGARYYASSMGRFLTPDWSAKAEPVPYSKLDDPQTFNLYAYVGNNPYTRIDGDGHDCSMSSGGSTPECNAAEKATAVEDYVFGQGGFAVGMRPGDPPAQSNAASSGSTAGSPFAPIQTGGTTVTGTFDSYGSIGVTIHATPSDCADCQWIQQGLETGPGSNPSDYGHKPFIDGQDVMGNSPLMPQGGCGSNCLDDQPSRPASPRPLNWSAIAVFGHTNEADHTFRAMGAIRYGFSISGGGTLTVRGPVAASRRQMRGVVNQASHTSKYSAWSIQ